MFQAKHNLDVLIQFFRWRRQLIRAYGKLHKPSPLSLALMVRSKSWL